MNKLIIGASLVLLAVLSIATGCEEKYKYIDYSKYEKEEKEILKEFYESAKWDSIKDLSTLYIDDRDSTGLMYLERVKGTGDSVMVGKQVGIRYTYYLLTFDKNENPAIIYGDSNNNSEGPLVFTVGETFEEYYQGGVFRGFDLGVMKMCNNGKSTFIMPSPLNVRQNYTTIIADVELVFTQLD